MKKLSIINKETFEVCVFDNINAPAYSILGDLDINTATKYAKNTNKTGQHLGVMVISEDSNNLNPIVLTLTKKVKP